MKTRFYIILLCCLVYGYMVTGLSLKALRNAVIKSNDNQQQLQIKQPNKQGYHQLKHAAGVELLDRHDFVDRLLAFFEDPRCDLTVGLIAGSFAIVEVLQDFKKLGGHHGLALITLLHSVKALMGVLKESKRALKGYAARFHN